MPGRWTDAQPTRRPATALGRAWRRCRRAAGSVLPLVIVVVAIILSFLLASTITTSSTARAVARASELALMDDAGQTALLEAAAALSASLVLGAAPIPGGPDWRKELLPPYDTRMYPSGDIAPYRTQFLYSGSDRDFAISLVSCKVVRWTSPPIPPGGLVSSPPSLPQGVIEMSVTVQSRRGLLSLRRNVLQRRSFWVTIQAPGTSSGQPIDLTGSAATVGLEITPLGTVLLP